MTLALLVLPWAGAFGCLLLVGRRRECLVVAMGVAAAELVLAQRTPALVPLIVTGVGTAISPLGRIVLLLATAVVLGSLAYVAHQGAHAGVIPLSLAVLGSVAGVAVSEAQVGAVFLYIGALLAIAAWRPQPGGGPVAVTLGRYLALSGVGGTVLLAVPLLGAATVLHRESGVMLSVVAALLTLGVGVRLPLVPFHTWTPDLNDTSTPQVPLLLATALSAATLLWFVQIAGQYPWVLSQEGFDRVLMVIGSGGALASAVLAVLHRGRPQVLAYSTTYALGIILFGLVSGTASGVTGAIGGIIAFALGLLCLYLAMDDTVVRQVSGSPLARRGLAWTRLAGVLTIVGAPPFGAFAPRWLIYQTALSEGWAYLAVLLLATGIMLFVLLGVLRPSEEPLPPGDRRERRRVRTPLAGWVVIPGLLSLAMGLYPFPVLQAAARAVEPLIQVLRG